MKVIHVSYHALFNLGDYENEKIELTARLDEGETPEDVVPKLREKVISMAQPSSTEQWTKRSKMERELYDLEKKLAKVRDEWNATAEFLRTQGIKADAPNMPEFNKLLNPASTEDIQVVEGELDGTPF